LSIFISESVMHMQGLIRSCWKWIYENWGKSLSNCIHSPTYEIVIFWKVWCTLNFVQVRIEYTCGQLCTYIKGIYLKSKLQPWNLIDHSMTAMLPVFLLSTIFPPPSSHCIFIPARTSW